MTNNAPAHRTFETQKKLAYLGSHRLNHQNYSPDLVPSDCHLFPGLKKKQLKVRHFSSDEEVAAAETWSNGLLPEFDLTCKNQSDVLRSVLSFVGSVLDRSRVWSLQLLSFLAGLSTYQHPLLLEHVRSYLNKLLTHMVQSQNISHEQQAKLLDCMSTYHFMMNYIESHNDQPYIKSALTNFPTKFVKFTCLLNQRPVHKVISIVWQHDRSNDLFQKFHNNVIMADTQHTRQQETGHCKDLSPSVFLT